MSHFHMSSISTWGHYRIKDHEREYEGTNKKQND